MPILFEQQKSSHPPRPSQRLSHIPVPRPSVHHTIDNGINHASKPTIDLLPKTPSAKSTVGRAQENQNKSSDPQLPIQDSDPELAILDLIPFSRQPVVNFGKVQLGTTKIRYVVLRNSCDMQQQMFVKTFPKSDKGFCIDATEFLIAPRAEIFVALAWTPRVVGGVRETITFQDVNRMPKRIVLIGSVYRPKPNPPPSRSARGIPRLFRKSPAKTNRSSHQERARAVMSPRRMSGLKRKPGSKPLTKLINPTPTKHHPIVRKILSNYDHEMATKTQSYCRMVLARTKLISLKKEHQAAHIITRAFRIFIAKRELMRLRRRQEAIVAMQAFARGFIVRGRVQREKAVVKVQSYFRMILDKRYLSTLRRRRDAAVTIQSYCRGLKARRKRSELVRQRDSVIKIQSYIRGHLARRNFRREKAAIKLQSYTRMLIAKKHLKHMKKRRDAAVVLQSHLRGVLTRRDYEQSRRRIIMVQSLIRRYLAKKHAVRERMALKIQSFFKVILARKVLGALRQRNMAAIVLQTHFRGLKARRELVRLRRFNRSVVVLQSHARGILARKKLQRSIDAALRIQARALGYV